MALFGATVGELLQYLAPKDATDLANFGYDSTELQRLLDEKSEIVFSYLPQNYRDIYEKRVYRLIIVEFAFDGQTQVTEPFTGASNVIGYLNPTGRIEDLKQLSPLTINVTSPNWTFEALKTGDKLIADFSHDFSNVEIKPLSWATRVLAALEMISQLSEELESGELVERVQAEGEKIFPWLSALNSDSPGDKVVIKELEKKFWCGDDTFTSHFMKLSKSGSMSRG